MQTSSGYTRQDKWFYAMLEQECGVIIIEHNLKQKRDVKLFSLLIKRWQRGSLS